MRPEMAMTIQKYWIHLGKVQLYSSEMKQTLKIFADSAICLFKNSKTPDVEVFSEKFPFLTDH